MSIKLYGHPLSGNCHKVRLLLSALGLPYEEVLVDLLVGAHKQPEFLALNPLGQVFHLACRPGGHRGLQDRR